MPGGTTRRDSDHAAIWPIPNWMLMAADDEEEEDTRHTCRCCQLKTSKKEKGFCFDRKFPIQLICTTISEWEWLHFLLKSCLTTTQFREISALSAFQRPSRHFIIGFSGLIPLASDSDAAAALLWQLFAKLPRSFLLLSLPLLLSPIPTQSDRQSCLLSLVNYCQLQYNGSWRSLL